MEPDTDHRGGRRTQERGDITRQALLDSALHEFAASGFDAASTRAIAARAGVRQGQLTYHFESKVVLWRAAGGYLLGRFACWYNKALGTRSQAKSTAVLVRRRPAPVG